MERTETIAILFIGALAIILLTSVCIFYTTPHDPRIEKFAINGEESELDQPISYHGIKVKINSDGFLTINNGMGTATLVWQSGDAVRCSQYNNWIQCEARHAGMTTVTLDAYSPVSKVTTRLTVDVYVS